MRTRTRCVTVLICRVALLAAVLSLITPHSAVAQCGGSGGKGGGRGGGVGGAGGQMSFRVAGGGDFANPATFMRQVQHAQQLEAARLQAMYAARRNEYQLYRQRVLQQRAAARARRGSIRLERTDPQQEQRVADRKAEWKLMMAERKRQREARVQIASR